MLPQRAKGLHSYLATHPPMPVSPLDILSRPGLYKRGYKNPCATLLFSLLLPTLTALGNTGGGYLDRGLAGEYFANANLTAPAAFTRREVRLDFDWGTLRPVGGSIAEPYASFPIDQFSVRYTGRLMARFSETYTFKLTGDDGARLLIKPEGAPTYITLLDRWSESGTFTATYALTAGTAYSVQVEYRELTGAASLRLLWSSPSTPEEVIDVAAHLGSNVTHWGQAYTDIAKCARNNWLGNNGYTPSMDPVTGWPTTDFQLVFQESLNQGLGLDPLMRGKISFSFKGKGVPSVWGNVNAGSMTYSYNAGTNTTNGSFLTLDNNINASYFRVQDTDRDGLGLDHDGVTDLKLMRPTAPDASTSYAENTLFLNNFKTALEQFTALRVNLNNGNQERFWSDRTLPAFFNQESGRSLARVYSAGNNKSNGASWEYKILLCNETGRDLYANIPMCATGWTVEDATSYVYKLALLIKYGSDGVEPYSSPPASPVYPPLNPNLRCYVELSNEYWNFGGDAFRQYWDLDAMTQADANEALFGGTGDPLARPADYLIFNYDNQPLTKDANGYFNSLGTWRHRKIALRIKQISDIFRTVFGDAAMMTRIRPVLEWQYANTNGTAERTLGFLDDYFNNANGQTYVAEPHPVNHFLYGGGGASYYGAKNGNGVTDLLPNPSFETPTLPAGYNANPTGATWRFQGTAGIARDGGPGDNIPAAEAGSQVGYITDLGALEIDVTFPTSFNSNVFGVVFKAVNPEGTAGSALHKFRVLIDGLPVNARSYSQSNGYQPLAYDPTDPWYSNVVFWTRSEYYFSDKFTCTPGQTRTVRFEGVSTGPSGGAGTVFIEDVRIGAVDQLFADGLPGGGEAAGQPAGMAYEGGLKDQSHWAHAYGLRFVTYEGGWSLGGDNGGSPMQNEAKYHEQGARLANVNAMDMFHRAGGYLNVFGTYAQWPSWSDNFKEEGLLNVAAYPLLQGQTDMFATLPAAPDNGYTIPRTIPGPGGHVQYRGILSSGTVGSPGGWISYSLVAPATANYQFVVTASGGGTLVADLDGAALGAPVAAADAASQPYTIRLEKGLHSLRIRSVNGSVVVSSIAVTSDEVVAEVTYDPPAGNYLTEFLLNMSTTTSQAAIWYTTDGSQPTEGGGTSIRYLSPVWITQPVTIKASAFKAGLFPSLPTTASYTFVLPVTQNLLLASSSLEADLGALHAVNDGFGFGAWSVQNSDVILPGYQIESGSLSYGNLLTAGQRASGGRAYLSITRYFDVTGALIDYTEDGVDLRVDQKDLWFSYLIHPVNNTQNRFGLCGAPYWNSNTRLEISRDNGNWKGKIMNGDFQDTGVAATTGQTYLIVLHVTFGGTSSVDVFINPASIGGAAPANPVLRMTTTSSDFKFRRIDWSPGSNAGNGQIDEIRVGDSYAAVTPLQTIGSEPTVVINQAAGQADPASASPILFTATFSEPVTGLTNADIFLTGSANPTTAVVTGGPTVYEIAVSGMNDSGLVQASIPAGLCAAVDDGALNLPSTSTDNSVIFTVPQPGVTIDQAAGQEDPAWSEAVLFTVVFSESVTGLTGSDVIIGGTALPTTAVVSGSGTTYTVTVSGLTQPGTVWAVLASNAAFDSDGLGNTPSTSTDNEVYWNGRPVSIATVTLPAGEQTVPYYQTIMAQNGLPPYTFSLTAGNLPDGLLLHPTSGTLSGTPSAGGDFSFSIQVQDSVPRTAARDYSINIVPYVDTAPQIVTSALPDGTLNTAYSQTLTATGGNGSLTWSLAAGTLPPGISLGSTGLLSGLPAQEGVFNFTVQVADSDMPPDIDTQACTMTIIATGQILREWWTNLSGTAVSNLTSSPNYPNSPAGAELLTSCEGPTSFGDNYGTRLRGFVHPPVTGSYVFYIASDDASQLFLSTDTNPANKVLIARVDAWTSSRSWTAYPTLQNSAAYYGTINLQAGQKYYLEALHKEGSGGDNIAVGWTGPSPIGATVTVIAGQYLSPWVNPPASAPGSLSATAVSTSQIDLNWTDTTGNESYFRVERSPNGTTDWTVLASVPGNITTHSNTGLPPGTLSFYRVFAVNAGGDSPPSNIANATTQAAAHVAVQNPTIQVGGGNLSFTVPSVPGQTYYLQRNLTTPRATDANWSNVDSITGDGTAKSFQVPTPVSGGAFYRIRSTN